MKKKTSNIVLVIYIAASIALTLSVILFLTGCNNAIKTVDREPTDSKTSMFVVIESTRTEYCSWNVVYHKDTKVMYVITEHGGCQPLTNADGSPMLYTKTPQSFEEEAQLC